MLFYSANIQSSGCIRVGAMEGCFSFGALPTEPKETE